MKAKKSQTKRPKVPDDKDAAQRKRFVEAAKSAVADGGLSDTEAAEMFERTIKAVTPPKRST